MSYDARFAPEPESEPVFNSLVDTDPDQQFNVRQAGPIAGYLDDLDDDAADYSHTPLDFADERMTQLGLTLDFGPRDLAANRAGWLTEAQIERLAGDLRWVYWPIIIALVSIALVIGATSIAAGTLTALPFVLLGLAAIPALLLKNER
ncbi:MAG: hypothetical protein JXA10_02635, partial [Anaerolineae bacterium]|nr:hypothetical protein [Anaerolineae bacterium]